MRKMIKTNELEVSIYMKHEKKPTVLVFSSKSQVDEFLENVKVQKFVLLPGIMLKSDEITKIIF